MACPTLPNTRYTHDAGHMWLETMSRGECDSEDDKRKSRRGKRGGGGSDGRGGEMESLLSGFFEGKD